MATTHILVCQLFRQNFAPHAAGYLRLIIDVQMSSIRSHLPSTNCFGHRRRPPSTTRAAGHKANDVGTDGVRCVAPFSVASLQKNTRVRAPPMPVKGKMHHRTKMRKYQCHTTLDCVPYIAQRHHGQTRPTSFRMYFERGDLPIKMEYLTGGERIAWSVDVKKLDYTLYLPLFFDGLSETRHPYKTYARQGVQDLLQAGGNRIYAVIPLLILPIKSAHIGQRVCACIVYRPCPYFRCPQYAQHRCDVHHADHPAAAGDVVGSDRSGSGAVLPATVAHI